MEDNEILDKEFLKIREDFKFFENNKDIIYLDSAAMTQKPNIVLEDVLNYYNNSSANVGRSLNRLDIQNRQYIENLRKNIISFLNLKELNREYIVKFTHNTTRAVEIVANKIYKTFKDGDKINILFSENEHKATISPWKKLKEKCEQDKRNISIKIHNFSLDSGGYYDEDRIKEIVRNIPKDEKIILLLTAVHSISGMDMDVTLILKENKEIRKDIFVVIDASQQMRNMRIDYRKEEEPDIIIFNSSKMYGLEGVRSYCSR